MCRFRQHRRSPMPRMCLTACSACARLPLGLIDDLFSGGKTISGLALLLFASPLTLLEQTSGVARVILGILLAPFRLFLGAYFSKMVSARRDRPQNHAIPADVSRGRRPSRIPRRLRAERAARR